MKKVKTSPNSSIISHEYFQGHQCSLPAEKLSTLTIKCAAWQKIILEIITVTPNDARARNLYKSYASLCEEKYRHYMHYPFIIHPFSKLRLWLEMSFVLSTLLCYTAVAWNISETYKLEDLNDIILHASDVMMLTNILTNLFTGYVDGYSYRRVILDPFKIFSRYLKSWLALDILSAASFLPHLLNIQNVTHQIILTSLKILRIPPLYRYLENINRAYRSGVLLKTCQEILISLYVYLMWSVFFQFSIEYVAEKSFHPKHPRNCSWIYKAQLWNASTTARFIYSFHMAVGLLRKHTNTRFFQHGCYLEIFIMISWIFGKILLLYCGLKYFVAVYGVESAACKYYKIRKQVEMYMKQRKLPPRIKEKILKFYAIRYQTTFFVEERILPCVSGQLREDIIMHTGRQLLRELTFMKHLPKKLLLQISFQLKLVIFTAGDIIYKIKDLGECVYFIDKGTVAVYSESGREICHLEDGDFFGEIALVLRYKFRTTSVVAVSNCEVFMLDKDDFNKTIACYPTVYEHIKEVATWRHERTCVLDERHKTEMSHSNDNDNSD